ncbi:MAG: cell division protein ZapA [Desulfobacteraceae bacterium]
MDEIVKIELFGQEFKFQPDNNVKDSQKVVDAVKLYIAEAEKQFNAKNTGRDKMAILLLAAMNLSKDYYELQTENARLEAYVSQKAAYLLEKINKSI